MGVLDLLGAALALVLVLVVIPRRVFPRMPDALPLEQLAADLVWAVAAVTATAVVLVPVGMFQTLCYLLLAVGGMWIRWNRRGGTLRAEIEKAAVRGRAGLYLLEAASRDGNDEVKRAVKTWLRKLVVSMVPSTPRADRALRWMLISPLFAIVTATTIVSLLHPFRHAGLFPASAYDTLAHMGELGFGRLFDAAGNAPGLSAVLATAAKLGPASNDDVIRFAGPLLLVPTLMLVYGIALRVSANPGMSYAAVALTAFASLRPELLPGIELPGTVAASVATPVALASVLLAMGYAASPTTSRATTLAAAGLATVLLDPSFIVIPVVAAAAAAWAASLRGRRAWIAARPLCFSIVATIVGFAPYAMLAVIRGSVAVPLPSIAITTGVLTVVSGLAAIVVFVRAVDGRIPAADVVIPFAAVVLVGCVVGQAAFLLCAGPLLAVNAVRGRRRPQVTAQWLTRSVAWGAAACLALLVVVQPGTPPPAAASEHESAAVTLDRILDRGTAFTYTVVGPPTWTSRVVGTAYRVDLAEFAWRLSTVDAIDPGFSLPVPSKRVLVLTEKEAFPTTFGGHPYDDPAARAQLMADVESWLETYAQFHSDATIVYEDDSITVWSIEQARDAALSERFGIAHQ